MYTQGDIVLVPFPFTDQTNSVKRPALVISGSKFNQTDDVVLVQITKVDRNDEYSVAISTSDLTKPLKFISEIRCHKILVADQSLVIHPISKVSDNIVQQVIKKINGILNN